MMKMEPVIPPVEREVIEAELTKDRFIRTCNVGSNEIYVVTAHDSPNIMREIGRIREIAFRVAGGGTGKSVDIDEFDISENPYKQLILWNPEEKEIVGGYRYINCAELKQLPNGKYPLATAHLFEFSQKFIDEYFPYTIELGRSFIQTHYQHASPTRKGLYSLDNIWDGLGAIVVQNPQVKYFFGKVTMYLHYNSSARDMLIYFMDKYFRDKEGLVIPLHLEKISMTNRELENIFCGANYEENFKILNSHVRGMGEIIPPLFSIYMNVSSTMRFFGSSLNDSFGPVEESGMLVTIADIYDSKRERHISSYKPQQ